MPVPERHHTGVAVGTINDYKEAEKMPSEDAGDGSFDHIKKLRNSRSASDKGRVYVYTYKVIEATQVQTKGTLQIGPSSGPYHLSDSHGLFHMSSLVKVLFPLRSRVKSYYLKLCSSQMGKFYE